MGREVEIERRIEVGAGHHRYHVVEGWPQLPEGVTIQEVVAVACDSEGRAHVFNRGSHPIMIFDRAGHFIDNLEAGTFARPHGITIGPDNTVYCVDDFDHTVKRLSHDGRSLSTLGKSGAYSNTGAITIDYGTIARAGPPFNYPTNLAVAPSGELCVTDGYGNARVHRFSPEGRLLDSWGEPGTGPGQFQLPHGIAIARDRARARVRAFAMDSRWSSIRCGSGKQPYSGIYFARQIHRRMDRCRSTL